MAGTLRRAQHRITQQMIEQHTRDQDIVAGIAAGGAMSEMDLYKHRRADLQHKLVARRWGGLAKRLVTGRLDARLSKLIVQRNRSYRVRHGRGAARRELQRHWLPADDNSGDEHMDGGARPPSPPRAPARHKSGVDSNSGVDGSGRAARARRGQHVAVVPQHVRRQQLRRIDGMLREVHGLQRAAAELARRVACTHGVAAAAVHGAGHARPGVDVGLRKA